MHLIQCVKIAILGPTGCHSQYTPIQVKEAIGPIKLNLFLSPSRFSPFDFFFCFFYTAQNGPQERYNTVAISVRIFPKSSSSRLDSQTIIIISPVPVPSSGADHQGQTHSAQVKDLPCCFCCSSFFFCFGMLWCCW